MKLRKVTGGGTKLRDATTQTDRLRKDGYDMILDGVLAAGNLTGSLVKQTNKILAGVAGACTGALNKAISIIRVGELGGFVGSLSKQTNKILNGVLGDLNGSLTSAHAFLVQLGGEIVGLSGGLVKQTNKLLSGVPSTLTGTLTTARTIAQALGGTLEGMTGTIATYVVGHITGAVAAVTNTVKSTVTSFLHRNRAVAPPPRKNDVTGPDQ